MKLPHALAAILMCIAACAVAKPPKSVVIEFNPDISEKISVQTAWLAYASYLAKWATSPANFKHVCNRGAPLPFESELFARKSLVTNAWSKLKINDPEAVDDYLDGLSQIEREGFMSEYVWSFHHRNGWREPKGLRLAEFKLWQSKHLLGWQPRTLSGMEIKC